MELFLHCIAKSVSWGIKYEIVRIEMVKGRHTKHKIRIGMVEGRHMKQKIQIGMVRIDA